MIKLPFNFAFRYFKKRYALNSDFRHMEKATDGA